MARGEDFFRGAVIEALGDYKAQYAIDAITTIAKLDGPLQDDSAIALGRIGDKRSLETLAGLQRTAPRPRQPAIAAAICLLGVNCDSHEPYLIETLKFGDKNPGFQELLRGAAAGLGALAISGRPTAATALLDVGIPSRDPTRAPVALALAAVALRNTPLMLQILEQRSDRAAAIGLVAEGFDMLEEDLDKERFFAFVRRSYWASAEGSATRALMQSLIGKSGFLMDYRQSGVDIDAGNETVRRIKSLARATFTPGVLSEIGSFGGLFALDPARHQEPVLVSSADGVGTKLKVAFMIGRHDTIGEDLVNHCVNDILVQGATPLFFLDYLATGRLSPDVAEQVVTGVARGCRENGCALIGGETAEMPGFYADGEYDIAGFIVGVVERQSIVDGRRIAPGDVLIGLPSSGLHTNGYSLARRVLFDVAKLAPDDAFSGARSERRRRAACHSPIVCASGPAVARCRSRQGDGAHHRRRDHRESAAHPARGVCAPSCHAASWTVPPLFSLIQKLGSVSTPEMFRAFNMGIGLILVCAASDRRACPGAPGRWRERAAPPCWARWKPATAPCGISREPPPRRADFRPRQQSSVDHRRHRPGRARCHGGGRDLESCRTPRASPALGTPASRR